MESKAKPLSMAGGAMVMKSIRIFLRAGKAASEKHQTPSSKISQKEVKKKKPAVVSFDRLLKTSKFNKTEIDALFNMYKNILSSSQNGGSSAISLSSHKGIDQATFRDVMHNTFTLVTEEIILERLWITWNRGASGGEGAIKFEPWVKGLSLLLRGTKDEQIRHCFAVYDLNADGYITRDEMFTLLRNSLLKQPGDEDPDEGVRDLVELVLKKLDVDKDGKVSFDDYRKSVHAEPLLLEAFGQCIPSRRQSAFFFG